MNRVVLAALCTVALTACERDRPSAAQTYTVFADEICACKDTQCVEEVMERWGKSTKAAKEWPMFRKDEASAKAALEDRINGCRQILSPRGSDSRPHSTPQIILPSE